jgi:hypothetical protein
MKSFTDGNVNPYEREQMKQTNSVSDVGKKMGFHHFSGTGAKCDKCGMGKSMMFHRADNRVHKMEEVAERHRKELYEIRKMGEIDLSAYDVADALDISKAISKTIPTNLTPTAGVTEATSGNYDLLQRILSGDWPGNYKGKKTKKNTANNGAWGVGVMKAEKVPANNGDKAASSTTGGRMRKERMLALRRSIMKREIDHIIETGEPHVVISKTKVAAEHNTEIRQGWETDPASGNRKWQVTHNNRETHSFGTPEEAFGYAYGDGSDPDDEAGSGPDMTSDGSVNTGEGGQ